MYGGIGRGVPDEPEVSCYPRYYLQIITELTFKASPNGITMCSAEYYRRMGLLSRLMQVLMGMVLSDNKTVLFTLYQIWTRRGRRGRHSETRRASRSRW